MGNEYELANALGGASEPVVINLARDTCTACSAGSYAWDDGADI